MLKSDNLQKSDSLIFLAILGGVVVRVMQILTILDMLNLTGVDPIKSVICFTSSIMVFDLTIFQLGCAVGNSPRMSYGAQLCLWPAVVSMVEVRDSLERDISSLRAFGPGGGQASGVVRVSARALLVDFCYPHPTPCEGAAAPTGGSNARGTDLRVRVYTL